MSPQDELDTIRYQCVLGVRSRIGFTEHIVSTVTERDTIIVTTNSRRKWRITIEPLWSDDDDSLR